jgi:predicted RND superfamily exporter protein
MRREILFVVACNGFLAVALAVAWAAGAFAYLGVDSGIATAIVVGLVVASEVAIALMALVFYSEESGQDEAAYHVHRVDDSDRH